MASWPTGVAVVTSTWQGNPVGCTVNSLMSWSVDPPSVAVALNSAGRTVQAVRASGRFGISILDWARQDLCSRFAGGAQRDRFTGVDLLGAEDVPLVRDSLHALACTVQKTFAWSDHTLVLGLPSRIYGTGRETPLVLHGRALHRLPRAGVDASEAAPDSSLARSSLRLDTPSAS
ncbi:flavin reductase family protein [Streptomyces lavendulae]|uniref:flavin reductase family protein n=1 Tax=Streptomyces lavendulae TaxID=1914 RepID=UPI003D7F52E7